jgi:hypothetical protein
MLVKGVAFKKSFSYAGFEQQPKTFKNPKVLSLNVELELKAEKDNAEVRVEQVSVNSLIYSSDCRNIKRLSMQNGKLFSRNWKLLPPQVQKLSFQNCQLVILQHNTLQTVTFSVLDVLPQMIWTELLLLLEEVYKPPVQISMQNISALVNLSMSFRLVGKDTTCLKARQEQKHVLLFYEVVPNNSLPR